MTANAFAEDCRLGKAKRAQHPWKQIKPAYPEQFNAMLLKWLERTGVECWARCALPNLRVTLCFKVAGAAWAVIVGHAVFAATCGLVSKGEIRLCRSVQSAAAVLTPRCKRRAPVRRLRLAR
jgi:hypothetical protein